jgi:hypothetical protein
LHDAVKKVVRICLCASFGVSLSSCWLAVSHTTVQLQHRGQRRVEYLVLRQSTKKGRAQITTSRTNFRWQRKYKPSSNRIHTVVKWNSIDGTCNRATPVNLRHEAVWVIRDHAVLSHSCIREDVNLGAETTHVRESRASAASVDCTAFVVSMLAHALLGLRRACLILQASIVRHETGILDELVGSCLTATVT